MDKLEIGSGKHPTPGYDHLDINADLPCLEYINFENIPSECYSQVYGRHVLEHMTRREASSTIAHCHRILKPHGKLVIIVPNLSFHTKQLSMSGKSKYFDCSNFDHAMAGLYGWQRTSYDIHKWGYTRNSLDKLLRAFFRRVGFDECRECDLSAWAIK